MGKCNSKNTGKEKLECKDWKYVELKNPQKTKHLEKWIKNYRFNGQLNGQDLCKLQGAMEQKHKGNLKGMNKEGYEDVMWWRAEAKKREEGERRRRDQERQQEEENKRKEKEEEKEKEIMFHRKEDDETGYRRLYPALPPSAPPPPPQEQPQPPPNYELTASTSEKSQSQGRSPIRTRSKDKPKISPRFKNPPKFKGGGSVNNLHMIDSDQFPLIQVANPNAGGQNQEATMLVYRTWTIANVKKTIEGVTPHKEDVNQFVADMENLRRSYHLNGHEVQQIWMHWHSGQIGTMCEGIGIQRMWMNLWSPIHKH